MSGRALILAAHGSDHEPATARLIHQYAAELRRLQLFDEITPAFHQGRPGFDTVLDTLHCDRVVVVPLMTSGGYYSEVVLPQKLAANRRFGEVELQQTAPVGTHRGMADVVARRGRSRLETFELAAAQAAVLVIGHGTPRHPRSRRSTEALCRELAARLPVATVTPAFLDDEPAIGVACDKLAQYHLVAVPFLIGMGPHVRRDIPTQLGIDDTPDADWPLVAWQHGRRIICDHAVGTYEGILDLVVDLALGCPAPASRPARTIKLGARGSRLSRWQAEHVAALLERRGRRPSIVEISTTGDRDLVQPISELPGSAPFADDIERALHSGLIDLAVHSLKDLSTQTTAGLSLAAILPRADAGEALVSRDHLKLADLPPGAVVGTSSPRRVAQLLAVRPDLRTAALRGPVEQRVRQVREADLDAAILAVAGLERLGLLAEISERLPLDQFVPAPAQGALAVQVRSDDAELRALCDPLNDRATRQAATAELAFLEPFEQRPGLVVAAYATWDGRVHLHGRLIASSGAFCDVTAEHEDPLEAARCALNRLAPDFAGLPEFA